MAKLYTASEGADERDQGRILRRDRRSDMLVCKRCGERFISDEATTDGWYYACPNEVCDGTGIGDDLARLTDALFSDD